MGKRQRRASTALRIGAGLLLGSLIAVAFLAYAVYSRSLDGWEKYRPLSGEPTLADAETSKRFLARPAPRADDYDALFAYFLHGFIANASSQPSLVHYPGVPGSAGYAVNGLEGFARTATLFAAWIYSGRPQTLADPQSGATVDVVSLLRRGLLAGTDPQSPGYWGEIGSNDQRIVEAADIARILWLTRPVIWSRFSDRERDRVAAWLAQVNQVAITHRNNWILFPVVVNAFLYSVGYADRPDYSAYFEFKKNYRESGWYRDGRRGKVDYYNAWGISYDIFWIGLIDPTIDRQFIAASLVDSGRLTAHLISPRGIPMMGRSICYRTGIPAAVIAASLASPQSLSPAMARRALDVTWRYFVAHQVLRDNSLTMGYWETDPRLVDNYTGPGSCHWGLRSLTLAYMSGPDAAFWQETAERLPVETAAYRLELGKLGWTVTGNPVTQDIVIAIGKNRRKSVAAESCSLSETIQEALLHRPQRPDNHALKYQLREYSAVAPFGGAVSPAD
jgi:hypothetical protein